MASLFDEDDLPERLQKRHKPDLPQRQTWNRAAIHNLAVESQPSEIEFGERLKQWFCSSDGYTVKWHINQFHRHDFIISHASLPERKAYIELECGKDQTQWVSSIDDNRQRWKYGLNVLSRKIAEGQHYDVFIKYNRTGTSFFACTYDFARREGVVTTLRKHSLNFKTDSTVYAIPWSWVDDRDTVEFCADDPIRLRRMVDSVLGVQSLPGQPSLTSCYCAPKACHGDHLVQALATRPSV